VIPIGDRTRARRGTRRGAREFGGRARHDGARAAELLEAWVTQGDPSCFVEANAALALGRVRSRRAVEVLTPVLARRSYGDTIRARALEGLGASGDEAAYPVLAGAITRAASFQSRRAAVTSLGRLAEGTTLARDARERLQDMVAGMEERWRGRDAIAPGRRLSPDGIGDWFLPVVTEAGWFLYRRTQGNPGSIVRWDPRSGKEQVLRTVSMPDASSLTASRDGTRIVFAAIEQTVGRSGPILLSDLFALDPVKRTVRPA